MTLSEDRAKAQEMLGNFRNRRGDLDVRKVSEETFVLVYGIEKRLECATAGVARCPVTKGEKTFEEVHTAPKEPPKRDNPGPDVLNLTGKVKMRTIILIVIVIALIAVGGAAAAARLLGA